MNQEHRKISSICGVPIWAFVISPIMLILAPLLVWPHGYYQLLRLVTCVAAGIAVVFEYKNCRKNEAVIAAIVVLIFNPIVVIDLHSVTWAVIDYGIACLWIYFLHREGIEKDKIIVFLVITVVIAACVFERGVPLTPLEKRQKVLSRFKR